MQPVAKTQGSNGDASKKNLEALFDQPPKGIKLATKIDELEEQIAALKKQHDFLLSKERAAAIEEINSKIEKYSISARDLDFGNAPKATSTRAKVAVKYKSGTNSWTGRGRQPKWVADHIAKGGKLEDLLIK